jgi:hypothetical protein
MPPRCGENLKGRPGNARPFHFGPSTPAGIGDRPSLRLAAASMARLEHGIVLVRFGMGRNGRPSMKKGSRPLAVAVAAVIALAALAGGAPQVSAQGVGFLTEQQRLASYCAGVSETRIRELSEFIKNECAGSSRKECTAAAARLDKARIMDRRLWAYLMTEIFTSKDQGPRERALAQRTMSKGSDDWVACSRRPPGKSADDLSICRDSRGCLIDARFSFLPP